MFSKKKRKRKKNWIFKNLLGTCSFVCQVTSTIQETVKKPFVVESRFCS